jgi:hypothetical protein
MGRLMKNLDIGLVPFNQNWISGAAGRRLAAINAACAYLQDQRPY